MSIRIDLQTRAWIEDLPGVPADPENGIFDVALAGGFIHPGLDVDGVTTIETASQAQLDARDAFLADETKAAAALVILEPLLAGEKSILGGGPVEKVLYALGKALNKMSVTIEAAAEDLETPGATAADVRLSVIAYATAVKTAQSTYQADIARIRQAILAREGA